jgi:hypothetical protein
MLDSLARLVGRRVKFGVILDRQEAEKGESYEVLRIRTANIVPDLRRLYNDGKQPGELMPDGEASGIFVKIVMSADKPFTRKINGLLSHNANCFGPPSCSCSDDNLNNFTFDKKTHYGKVTFETLCHRAHVPVWQALGKAEPSTWSFTCDCCNVLPCCAPRPCHHDLLVARPASTLCRTVRPHER